ncbi:MAG: DUF3473 domain-containing protein [Bacteroidales bacterium]|nr:MAG: DUF3473 domain-containing protein [Bacteroidales bacterium]
MNNNNVSALSIDVEDAVNQAMRNFFNTDMEPTIRVYDNTMHLLDLLSEFDTKATFFILGEVAKTYPSLIKEMSGRGHELGIHGYSHIHYYKLSKEKAREEIKKAKFLVEDISGIEVIGHRAPAFSINHKTKWVIEVLIDAGIKYDSSIFPANSRHYGWPGFKKDIDWITVNNGRKIIEAPLSTLNFLGKEIPVCGGGYLRIFPFCFTNYAFKKIRNKRPVNVYMHPYEIDTPPFQQFYMDAIRKTSLKNKMQLKAYWFNRKSVIPKLRRLLGRYNFNTLRNVINLTLRTNI